MFRVGIWLWKICHFLLYKTLMQDGEIMLQKRFPLLCSGVTEAVLIIVKKQQRKECKHVSEEKGKQKQDRKINLVLGAWHYRCAAPMKASCVYMIRLKTINLTLYIFPSPAPSWTVPALPAWWTVLLCNQFDRQAGRQTDRNGFQNGCPAHVTWQDETGGIWKSSTWHGWR